VKRLVTPSHFLARAAAEMGPAVDVIPNLLALEEYPHRQRLEARPRLLWMRTFHELYNPQMAVRALGRLNRLAPGARMLMCGQEKGLLAEVRALADELGLAGAVEFRGFVSGPSKRAAFEESDIFLNTNRVDNMPISVLEAFAFGTPVVATRVGGIPDLIDDGRTGLLVPDGDDAAMADAVWRLLQDPRAVAQMSAAGRLTAERCGWESVRPSWERVFGEALG
jgi:glycosyltransferase involved in cell wall biosynthesis